MLPGALTWRVERGHRSLPVGGGGGAPFLCALSIPPSILPKSQLYFSEMVSKGTGK